MRPARAKSEGDSLIEVMIAQKLTAIKAIERATRWLRPCSREQQRDRKFNARKSSGSAKPPATAHWRTRAASMLPQGDVAVLDEADGVRVAVVSWHADDKADACAEPQTKANSACVALAFAR